MDLEFYSQWSDKSGMPDTYSCCGYLDCFTNSLPTQENAEHMEDERKK